MGFGNKPFGLRDVKIVSLDGATVEDLPSAQTFSFTERIKTGEMNGDDVLVSAVSFAEAVEWKIEAGGLSLEAYALMTGRSVTAGGTTPNQTNSMTGSAGDVFPWFKVYGQALGDASDGTHCKLGKVKITSLEGGFSDGEFWVTKCGGIAVGDDSGQIFEFVQNETATPLPTS